MTENILALASIFTAFFTIYLPRLIAKDQQRRDREALANERAIERTTQDLLPEDLAWLESHGWDKEDH